MRAFFFAVALGYVWKGAPASFTPALMPLLGEPALVHLQHVAHRLGGAVRVQRLRLHVVDVDDGAVVGDEGGRQRQQRVLHPEALLARLLEDEQHAFVLRHLLAVHQAGRALVGRGAPPGRRSCACRRTARRAAGRSAVAPAPGPGPRRRAGSVRGERTSWRDCGPLQGNARRGGHSRGAKARQAFFSSASWTSWRTSWRRPSSRTWRRPCLPSWLRTWRRARRRPEQPGRGRGGLGEHGGGEQGGHEGGEQLGHVWDPQAVAKRLRGLENGRLYRNGRGRGRVDGAGERFEKQNARARRAFMREAEVAYFLASALAAALASLLLGGGDLLVGLRRSALASCLLGLGFGLGFLLLGLGFGLGGGGAGGGRAPAAAVWAKATAAKRPATRAASSLFMIVVLRWIGSENTSRGQEAFRQRGRSRTG